MEKVVLNREKRRPKHPSGGVGGEHATAGDLASPASAASSSTASSPAPCSASTGCAGPHSGASPTAFTPTAELVQLQPENTNLLTLSRLVGDPFGLGGGGSVHPASVIDSQLVRRLTAEETHMVHELNQVCCKQVCLLDSRCNRFEPCKL